MPRNKWANSSQSPEYYAWRNMHRRCSNPNDAAYKWYGGRGISVCPRWDNFDVFVEDMGYRPPGLSIDRIDTNGNYEPGNCRWATEHTQHRNRTDNRIIDCGEESLPITDAAQKIGIHRDALWRRLDRGLPLEIALTPGRLNAPREVDHGTRLRYERDGCRCDKCRAFNAERGRNHRKRMKHDIAGYATLIADTLAS